MVATRNQYASVRALAIKYCGYAKKLGLSANIEKIVHASTHPIVPLSGLGIVDAEIVRHVRNETNIR
jgi:hypothetical protein